jgi:hypothetical protein
VFLIFYFLNFSVESEREHNENYKERTLIFCTEQILNCKAKYKDIHKLIVILLKVCNFCCGWPLWLLALGAKNPTMPLLIYFNSILFSIYGQLVSDVSSKLKGVASQNYNLNTDHLEKFHALSSDTYNDRITFHQNCQCRGSVIFYQ